MLLGTGSKVDRWPEHLQPEVKATETKDEEHVQKSPRKAQSRRGSFSGFKIHDPTTSIYDDFHRHISYYSLSIIIPSSFK